MSDPAIELSITRVRAYARVCGMTLRELARHAGLDSNALLRMEETNWNPTADTLRRVENVIPANFGQPSSRRRRRVATA
jgi:3,4-dihydroxy 2-butanone 4-phosphate synthase / GTP cyclohydrolase II